MSSPARSPGSDLPHAADLDRLRALAGELGVPEVEARLGELGGESPEAVRQILAEAGKLLLRDLSRQQASLPPAPEEAATRWVRTLPLFDTLAEMERRELAILRKLEVEAVASVRPFLAALPGVLLTECRKAVAEAGVEATQSGENLEDLRARLFRQVAARFREAGLDATWRLGGHLRKRLLAAVDALYPLALTWDRLLAYLEEREDLLGEPDAPSLVERLRQLRERWQAPRQARTSTETRAPRETRAMIAFELGCLREALGLGALEARITALTAGSSASGLPAPSAPQPPRGELASACLEALRETLSGEWSPWRARAVAAVGDHVKIRFAALAGELDRWLAESRAILRRRGGLTSEPLLALRALRFEIEDICRSAPVSESPSTGAPTS